MQFPSTAISVLKSSKHVFYMADNFLSTKAKPMKGDDMVGQENISPVLCKPKLHSTLCWKTHVAVLRYWCVMSTAARELKKKCWVKAVKVFLTLSKVASLQTVFI